ncbi:Hypothetical predicted protein [Cloeon dipterum]|uniref:Cullin N-terminal domain-containing protein n=1 Tax=Cloeon dipterum TaxID=197152 RepID=A0A8S1E8M3_9INSE|nr:Hypothetical predicted protein [Cloeon dipterum]
MELPSLEEINRMHLGIDHLMESTNIASENTMSEIREIKRRIKEELELKSIASSTTTTQETSDLKDYWDKVVPVATAVLKNPHMISSSSWIDAIQCVYFYNQQTVNVNLTIYYNLFAIIETHASEIKQNLAHGKLLETYCDAWNVYQKVSKLILTLFSHFNKVIVSCNKRNKITGSTSIYLTVDDMVKSAWFDHVLEPIAGDIGILVWLAIKNGEGEVARVQQVVQSFEEVGALDSFDTFFLEELKKQYVSEKKAPFEGMNAANFLNSVLHQVHSGNMFPDSSIRKLQEFLQNMRIKRKLTTEGEELIELKRAHMSHGTDPSAREETQ